MSLDTTYLLRLRQLWNVGGKPMENVFFYEHTAGSGDAFTLAEAFDLVMLPKINDLQWAGVQNSNIDVYNMGDPTDFISYPATGVGLQSGDSLPPHSAINFTMKLSTRAVRKGSKRFSGIPEAVQENGYILDAAYLAKMETLRLALFAELVSDLDTFLPIVVKRVKEPVVGTVPLQYTYRLPITDGELVVGEVATATTAPIVSHQVSREV